MSIRSLGRQLGRLSRHAGLRRCTCGAYLPPELYKPPRLDIKDEYSVPESLAALLPLATPAEAHELQTLLNRCLEERPDLSGLRGTSQHIFGAKPCAAPFLRFHFADRDEAGLHCPECGAAVAVDYGVRCVCIMAPTPAGLLDTLQGAPLLAARYEELLALLLRRAGLQTGSSPASDR